MKRNFWMRKIKGINHYHYCNNVTDINIRFENMNHEEDTLQLTIPTRNLRKLFDGIARALKDDENEG